MVDFFIESRSSQYTDRYITRTSNITSESTLKKNHVLDDFKIAEIYLCDPTLPFPDDQGPKFGTIQSYIHLSCLTKSYNRQIRFKTTY